MARIKLKFVHGYIDRHGRPRYYFRRTGFKLVPLPGLPWSPEFLAAYEAALTGQRVDVGRIAHACCQQSIERDAAAARYLDPIALQHAGHAEEVEDRLIDPVGGERAEAVEIRLPFKFERPRECAFQIRAMPSGQVIFASKAGGRVTSIKGAVAIAVLRIDLARAGRAAVGVRFADDYGFPF